MPAFGRELKFGIFDHLEFRDLPLNELYEQRLQLLEYADQAGFFCYHKAEHHFSPLDAAPSANVFLAAASQRTRHIRLGSLVYLLPFYEPLRLIEEICCLDQLCNGRLEVGVGKGISPAEHTLWGRDAATARQRFEEVFEILRLGLSESSLSYQGERYQYDQVTIPHRPLQRPQPGIWYPGNFEYAARHRLSTIVGGPPALVAGSVQKYQQALAKAEFDWNPGVEQPTIGATCHIYVARDRATALQQVSTSWPAYHRNLSYLFRQYDVAFAGGDPSLGGDTELALKVNALVAGSPEESQSILKA